MPDMPVFHARPDTAIPLGRQGEHLARSISFDVSAWETQYGTGMALLLHQRPGDSAPYPVAIRRDTDQAGNPTGPVYWDVTSTDTQQVCQYGKAELRWTVPGQDAENIIVKSAVYKTSVEACISAMTAQEVPAAGMDWIDSLLTDVQEATEAANAAALVNSQPVTSESNGLMLATDKVILDAMKSKLDGIPADATNNPGTITGITMNGASKGTSGVVDLGTVITAHQDISGKANAADVTTALAGKADTTAVNTALAGKVNTSAVGAANGVAELDSAGKVPSAQLPSYVDDVIEYNAQNPRPASGESGKIYVDTDTNLTYRWSGSAYVEISPSIALGETSSTAYRGDRGKTAYDHSQLTSGNPHNVTKSDVGLANVDNTSDANKPISTATQTALDGKVDKVTGKGLSTNDYTTAEKNGLAAAQETISAQGQTITAQAAQIALLQELVNGISAPVYRTKSASFVSFDDGAAANIKALSVQIAPAQSGTGNPSGDNICPISGWNSVTVTRSGKNMIPFPYVEVAVGTGVTKKGITYTSGSDGRITANNTATAGSYLTLAGISRADVPPGDYVLSAGFAASNDKQLYLTCKKSGEVTLREVGKAYVNNGAFTIPDDADYDSVSILIFYRTGQSANNDIWSPMLRRAEWQSDEWEVGNVNAVSVTLLDGNSNALTVYGGRVDMDYSANPATCKLTVTHGYIASYNGETLPGAWISDRDVYAANTTPTTGAQVVYELASADYSEYTLTAPSALATLHGINNLSANAGAVSVTYQADTTLSLYEQGTGI